VKKFLYFFQKNKIWKSESQPNEMIGIFQKKKMFESRVRKHAKQRSKRKVCDIYDDDGINIPMQHINRAAPGLLAHAFESASETLFVNNTKPLIDELRLLKETKKHMKHDCSISLNEYRDLLERIKDKKQEIVTTRMEKRNWIKQCTILRPGKLQSLVQANRLLKRPPEIYLIDSERCVKCHIPYNFNNRICRFRCVKCSVLRKVLYLPEDNSVDTLILKAKSSGTDNPAPKPTPAAKHKMEQTQILLDQQRAKKIVDSINNYILYISQYRDNVLPPSDEVRCLLALRLSPVHLCGKSKCRLPTVKLILKESKKFAHLEHHADRIMRDYIGQQIPRLSEDTNERLIKRFSHLLELGTPFKKLSQMTDKDILKIKEEPVEDLVVEEEENNDDEKDGNEDTKKINYEKKPEDVKRKIFQSEVITMMLLLIDGNREEAYKFLLHKTRCVLNECNESYLELVAQARLQQPELWPLNDANLL
jgi:hypothetical protein